MPHGLFLFATRLEIRILTVKLSVKSEREEENRCDSDPFSKIGRNYERVRFFLSSNSTRIEGRTTSVHKSAKKRDSVRRIPIEDIPI